MAATQRSGDSSSSSSTSTSVADGGAVTDAAASLTLAAVPGLEGLAPELLQLVTRWLHPYDTVNFMSVARRFSTGRAALLAAEVFRLPDAQGMGHLVIRGPRYPDVSQSASVGLRVKRQLVEGSGRGMITRWYARWLAWLQQLRALRVLAIGDMIVVDEARAKHVLRRHQVILPEETPTSWVWLEQFVGTVEEAIAHNRWPHLRELTLSCLLTAKRIEPAPDGPAQDTLVPEADAFPITCLVRALPTSVKVLRMGQFLPPAIFGALMRCFIGDGAFLPRVRLQLEDLQLHFHMLPRCISLLCAALSDPTGCLAPSLKELKIQGVLCDPNIPQEQLHEGPYTDDIVTTLLDALGTPLPDNRCKPLETLYFGPRQAQCAFHHWYKLTTLVVDGTLPHLINSFGHFPYRLPPPPPTLAPQADEDGDRVASFLVAAFEAGRFRRMAHFLTRATPLLRRPALARVLAAAPHAPPLCGPDEEEEEEEEREEEEGEGVTEAGATLKTVFFRLEPDIASLGEVTAWLRRGVRGKQKGLAALTQLELRCDELGALQEGSKVVVARAICVLLGAAMELPCLETLTLAWALPAADEAEDGVEAAIRDHAWQALRRAPPPPTGHYADAVLLHMMGHGGIAGNRPPLRLGVLAVACRMPGALPRVMTTAITPGALNHFVRPIIDGLGWRPLPFEEQTEYRAVRLAAAAPWPEQGQEADDFFAYDVHFQAP